MAGFTNVKMATRDGDLYFLDKDGAEICHFDGSNGLLSFPSTGKLTLAAGEVAAADIGTGAVTVTKIGAGAVTPPKVGTGLFDLYLADGQDETMTAAITVTGIVATDEVVGALVITTKASIASIAKRAVADFTPTANTLTVGANAANNTNNQYLFFVIHHA